REDDFLEGAADLDAMARWGATPQAVLYNRSEVNPVGLEMVPRNVITPALQRIAVTFSATTHMTCTYLVRVRDHSDRIHERAGANDSAPPPADYMPPVRGMN